MSDGESLKNSGRLKKGLIYVKKYLLLSLVCAVVIFALSAQDAATSNALSNGVTNAVTKRTGSGLSNPEMQSKWDKAFWARGYYVETIGNITNEAVQKYIKEQAEESGKEDSRGTAL